MITAGDTFPISGIIPGQLVIVACHGAADWSFRGEADTAPVKRGFPDYPATIRAARMHYHVPIIGASFPPNINVED